MRYLLLLGLMGLIKFQCLATGQYVSDYVLNYGYDYGTYYFQNGASADNAYAAYWLSTHTEPQVKLAVVLGFNNMDVKNYKGALFVGSRTSPYEISVSEGFVITGYTIIAQSISNDQTITPSEGGNPVTFTSTEESALIVEGLRTESTRFELTGNNTGLNILYFKVYVDTDAERTADLAAHYEAALATLTSGNQYWISTTYAANGQDATRYYLNAEGALTPNLTEANVFTLTSISNQSTFRPIGWQATGVSFSSPYIENGYLKNVNHIMTNIDDSRDDWEAQVYLKGDEHYAIRSTNVNSAEYFANTYWAVTDTDENGQPEANYSEERTYVWDVTPYDATVIKYLGYQAVANRVRQAANECTISSSPLYNELDALATQLQTSIDDGVAQEADFQDVDNFIASRREYWKKHVTYENLSALRQVSDVMHFGDIWDLDADDLHLDGVTLSEGSVTDITFSGKGLTGVFPISAFLALPHLKNLDLSENSISDIDTDWPDALSVNVANQNYANPVIFDLPTVEEGSVSAQLPPLLMYSHEDGGHTGLFKIYASSTDDETGQTWEILLENVSYGVMWFIHNENFVFRGNSGECYICQSYYGDAAGSTFPLSITFEQGDANFDGLLDIADLQIIINYMFDAIDKNDTFNYTAANLWEDDKINVQDVVREVDLLLDRSVPTEYSGVNSNHGRERLTPRRVLNRQCGAHASLYFVNGQLILDSETPVAALGIVVRSEANLDWSKLQAFGLTVSARAISDGVHIIAYSMSGAVVPAGKTTIAVASGHTAQIAYATLTDSAARHISLSQDSQITTGVGGQLMNGKSVHGKIYDLSGRNITVPSQPGIYIRDGRKEVLK